MCRPLLVVLVTASLFGVPLTADAGNNSSGTVRVSWDVEGLISTVSVPPATQFPLFVHIDGAPDIRELALHLRWFPFDSTGQCYSIVPLSADSACGWTAAVPPSGGGFEGDSTYTWSIFFPPGVSDRTCVIHWVSMASCDWAPPAKFYVADARTRDSNGAVDTLGNIGDAKIQGGLISSPPKPPPAELSSGPSLTASPNPASSGILLRFTPPQGGELRLGVYDVTGRLMRDMTREVSLDGSFHWDLKDASGRRVRPGLYYARLWTSARLFVLPLTVLR